MHKFKETYNFDARVSESKRIRGKYPTRVPAIVEVKAKSRIGTLDKSKYLVPNDITASQFTYVIRKRLKLKPEEAIFLLVDGMIPKSSDVMADLYCKHKDEDGFVYFFVSNENAFG